MTTTPCIKCNSVLPSEADPFIEGVCVDCRTFVYRTSADREPEEKIVIVNDKPKFKLFRPSGIIQAAQWFKNGDHPEDYEMGRKGTKDGKPYIFSEEECRAMDWEGNIVRYFRHPQINGESHCPTCGKTMHEHGWIENNLIEYGTAPGIVCPGDWIISIKVGGYRKYRIVENSLFTKQYKETK